MKPTTEELLLQILSTCQLISFQGTWLANLTISGHVSRADVTLYPLEHWDLPKEQRAQVDINSFPRCHANYAGLRTDRLSENEGQENLQHLLTWAQGFLDLGQEKEATPCAA